MAFTDYTRSIEVIDYTEGGSLVQNPENLVGNGTGDCIMGLTSTFLTIGSQSYQVPANSSITGIRFTFQAKKSTASDGLLAVTASVGGYEVAQQFNITNTSYTQYVSDVLELNPSIVNYINADNIHLTFTLEDNPQIAILGSNGGANGYIPSSQIHYTPLRWARVLTSGSNFPITTLTSTTLANIPSGPNVYPTLYVNTEGQFRKTGSIGYGPYTTGTPTFELNNGGPNLSQSLYTSGSSITSSGMPNDISIPDSGDFRSDVLWLSPENSGGPQGRVIKDSTIAVENTLTYEGSMVTNTNNNLASGSIFGGTLHNAPFIAPTGNDAESLPGCVLSFRNSFINSGDVGYADYSYGSYINIEFTSPRSGPSGQDFYITASFSIPYAVETMQQQECYVYLYRRVAPAGIGDWNGVYGPLTFIAGNGAGELGAPTGSLTGSFILPAASGDDLLIEGEKLELRVESETPSKPFHIGYFDDSQDDAFFRLEGENSTNFKPAFFFDTKLSSSATDAFQGSAWGSYSGSLGGVTLNPIPTSQALYRGDGILFLTSSGLGYTNTYTGNLNVTASIRLWDSSPAGNMYGGGRNEANLSGLSFTLGSGGDPTSQPPESQIVSGGFYFSPNYFLNFPYLTLTSSLPSDGLEWGIINNLTILNTLLSGSYSGLNINDAKLRLNPNIAGEGLIYSNGILSLDTASASGLKIDTIQSSTGLAITESLPGVGLDWKYSPSTNRTVIDIIETVLEVGEGMTGSVDIAAGPFRISTGSSFPPVPVSGVFIKYGSGPVINANRFLADYNTISHTSLQSFTPVTSNGIKISGDFATTPSAGDIFNTKTTHFKPSTGKTGFSSQYINLNNITQNPSFHPFFDPWKRNNGGFIVQTSTDYSGSAIFYASASTSPGVSYGGDVVPKVGWGLTTQSSVEHDAQYIRGAAAQNASYFIDEPVGIIQTVRTGSNANPNSAAQSVTHYDWIGEFTTDNVPTASLSKYGAVYIASKDSTPISESNVWIYLPEVSGA